MKINILTIGTRGDVQPYLGLGAGLAARGHDVAVQTLAEFKGRRRGHRARVSAPPRELHRRGTGAGR
jgi:UDP:flavonoid glycosyltransferase YjiC (YdhE family)